MNIYDAFYFDLYRYGFKLSKDEDLTKDCIQQIFMELWDKRSKLPEVTQIKSYLLKYLKRKIFKELSSKKKYIQDLTISEYLDEASYEDLLITKQQSHEIHDRLQRAISQLSARQMQIIMLKFYEGMSYDEIAEITHLQHRTVYNQLHRAVKELRKSMFIKNPFNLLCVSILVIIFSVF